MDNQVAHTTPRRPHHGGGGGREDCWSEGATETLIEAWGDRYVQLNRGNLRQKDWKEVADAVNVHRTGIKPPRTDIQCKNRIDTLKKKYKLEKSKPSPSKWPFYYRLNQLIGPNSVTPATKKSNRTSVTLIKSKPKPNPKPSSSLYSGGGSSRLNSSGSNESSLGGGAREDDDVEFGGGGGSRKHRMDYVDFSEETAYKELARAILRFGEIYERIESSKQQQMMELEKQRMEFTKELEVQRMNMFMDTQLELEKMKRNRKGVSGADCIRASQPLLIVLRIVDSDERLAMLEIFVAMEFAKKKIKDAFNNKKALQESDRHYRAKMSMSNGTKVILISKEKKNPI